MYKETGRITFCKPGKAKQTGANLNKVLMFKRASLPAGTMRNSKLASAALRPEPTAQDIYERNYETQEMLRIVLGEK